MLLHVYKKLGDGIDIVEVANLFVGDNQRCKHLFGKFSKNNLPMKSTFASLRQLRQLNNYELTMMTLKGKTCWFSGFWFLVFCFLIDLASIILSSMCIGLPRQCRK